MDGRSSRRSRSRDDYRRFTQRDGVPSTSSPLSTSLITSTDRPRPCKKEDMAAQGALHRAEDRHHVRTDFVDLGLHAAAARGDLGSVHFALSQGQPVNSVLAGAQPLHAAASSGNEAVVRVLLEWGADVNARRLPRRITGEGARGREGGAVGTAGSTALHFAAANSHLSLLSLLLSSGADPSITDKHSHTALDVAKSHGHREAASLLRDWAAASGKGGRKEKEGHLHRERSTSIQGLWRDKIHPQRSMDNLALRLANSSSTPHLPHLSIPSSMSSFHHSSRSENASTTSFDGPLSRPESPTLSIPSSSHSLAGIHPTQALKAAFHRSSRDRRGSDASTSTTSRSSGLAGAAGALLFRRGSGARARAASLSITPASTAAVDDDDGGPNKGLNRRDLGASAPALVQPRTAASGGGGHGRTRSDEPTSSSGQRKRSTSVTFAAQPDEILPPGSAPVSKTSFHADELIAAAGGEKERAPYRPRMSSGLSSGNDGSGSAQEADEDDDEDQGKGGLRSPILFIEGAEQYSSSSVDGEQGEDDAPVSPSPSATSSVPANAAAALAEYQARRASAITRERGNSVGSSSAVSAGGSTSSLPLAAAAVGGVGGVGGTGRKPGSPQQHPPLSPASSWAEISVPSPSSVSASGYKARSSRSNSAGTDGRWDGTGGSSPSSSTGAGAGAAHQLYGTTSPPRPSSRSAAAAGGAGQQPVLSPLYEGPPLQKTERRQSYLKGKEGWAHRPHHHHHQHHAPPTTTTSTATSRPRTAAQAREQVRHAERSLLEHAPSSGAAAAAGGGKEPTLSEKLAAYGQSLNIERRLSKGEGARAKEGEYRWETVGKDGKRRGVEITKGERDIKDGSQPPLAPATKEKEKEQEVPQWRALPSQSLGRLGPASLAHQHHQVNRSDSPSGTSTNASGSEVSYAPAAPRGKHHHHASAVAGAAGVASKDKDKKPSPRLGFNLHHQHHASASTSEQASSSSRTGGSAAGDRDGREPPPEVIVPQAVITASKGKGIVKGLMGK